MFKNLNEMQKKLIKIIIVGFILVTLLFLTIWLVNVVKGGKISYKKIEDKMVSAAEIYYEKNPDLLPSEDSASLELDVNTLVTVGNMKALNEYTDENVSCTGKVVVLKNGSHYTFIPKLDCGGDYITNSLVQKITSKNNIVTDVDGLYEINGEYVYRGEKLNNYVSFAGKTWRIIKITQEGEIRLIQNDAFDRGDWDNRYNPERKTTSGINNFEVSRIREDLDAIYNGTTFSAEDKAKLVPKQLCIGKRLSADQTKDGSTECATLTEEYFSIGLLQINEYLIGSLDNGCLDLTRRECTNYNFLANYDDGYWTITADVKNTYDVYYVDHLPQSVNARKLSGIKLVINVSGEVNYSKGNGTLENPYVID